MSHLAHYLTGLGCSQKDYDVFVYIYQFGPKPVSTIAKAVGLDRSYCYKVIQSLLNQGLIQETTTNRVKQYFCPSFSVLQEALQRKQQSLVHLDNVFDQVKTELAQLESPHMAHKPQLILFAGDDGIRNLFDDMKRCIESEKIISLSFVGSRLFESDAMSYPQRTQPHHDFLDYIKNKNLLIEGKLAQGLLVLDTMNVIDSLDELYLLVPGKNATHLYYIGSCLYMIHRHDQPIGLKVRSPSLLELMRLMI